MITTEYRINNPGSFVLRKGFADKLKDISHQLFSWAGMKPAQYYEDNPHCKDDFLSALNKRVREVWIEVGMKMREIYPPVWVDYLIQGTDANLLIIPDVRFPNEITAIQAKGGKVIRVDRPSIVPTLDKADRALIGYEGWDYIIENTGTLGDLHKNVVQFLEEWNNGQ